MKNKIKLTIIWVLAIIGIYLIFFSTKIGLYITTNQLLDTNINENTYILILKSNLLIPKITGIIFTIPILIHFREKDD